MNQEDRMRTARLLEETLEKLRSNAEKLDLMERSQRAAMEEVQARLDFLELDVTTKLKAIQTSNDKMGKKLQGDLAMTSLLLHNAELLEKNQEEMKGSLHQNYMEAKSDFGVERKNLQGAIQSMVSVQRALGSWEAGRWERQHLDTVLISLGSAVGGAYLALLMMLILAP